MEQQASNLSCSWFKNNLCELLFAVTNIRTDFVFCESTCGETDEAKIKMLKRHGIELAAIPATVEELQAKIAAGEIKTKPIPKPQPPEPIYTEPIKEMPGWLSMVRNAGKSALAAGVMAVIERRVFCCEAQRLARQAVCLDCLHREIVKGHERCVSFAGGEEGCGCYLEQKRKFAAVRCELGHWDESDAKYDVPLAATADSTGGENHQANRREAAGDNN